MNIYRSTNSTHFYYEYLQECKLQLTSCQVSQENSYSISHLLGTVTASWLDSDGKVTIDNCRQHGDWASNGSVVTVLPAVNNGDYTITVQSLWSHCAQ